MGKPKEIDYSVFDFESIYKMLLQNSKDYLLGNKTRVEHDVYRKTIFDCLWALDLGDAYYDWASEQDLELLDDEIGMDSLY